MIPASEALEISKTLTEFPRNVDEFLEETIRRFASNGDTAITLNLIIPTSWDQDNENVVAIMWIRAHLDFVRRKLEEFGYDVHLGEEYTLWISWNS